MISLLVVNYHSAALAVQAIQSARASGAAIDVVVVDNSCDEVEAETLRSHADTLLISRTNVGYAAAINTGRRHCKFDIAIVTNPDVLFFPGAIEHLVRELHESNRAVAGPALYWDDEQQWILPPADERTVAEKAGEIIAARVPLWRARRDRRRFRARVAFWSHSEPVSVPAISGAVMAIRLRDFDAVGGFDERFRLYFEETDFLRRIRRSGGEIVYVPSARCRHIYNQSAGAEREMSSALYALSEAAYYEKWYPRWIAGAIHRLQRAPAAERIEPCHGTLHLPRSGLVVEASPLPDFSTAAGHFATKTAVTLPENVWAAYRERVLYLRALDPVTGEVLATCARYRS